MTPEEAVAHFYDLVARCRNSNRQLAAAQREIERLRADLERRPSRHQYQVLADELERVRREYAATLARSRRVHGGH